jgi:hypothetical protein
LGEVSHERKETCKGSKEGYPIVGLEHLIPEEITLTTWDEGAENTFTKMFRKGDVLFGRRRAYLKKAAVAPFDGICSGDITVIEADGAVHTCHHVSADFTSGKWTKPPNFPYALSFNRISKRFFVHKYIYF